MNKKHLLATLSILLTGTAAWGQKVWTLQECFDYALANNIQLVLNNARLAAKTAAALMR